MDLSVILFGLKALLPGLGTVIYQIPKVRRYTRWIVSTFASIQSYLILIGMPPAEPVVDPAVPVEPTMAASAVMIGGISWIWANPITQGAVSVAWGFVDGWVSQQIHRSRKYRPVVKQAQERGVLPQ